MPRTAWSREEVEATVADYLAMLVEYHSGQPLNKAAHNRGLQRQLNDRSAAAIEFKHQNISAVLVEDGLDYLDGYLPAFNFQELLREVVHDQLDARPAVRELIRRVVSAEPPAFNYSESILPEEVPAPRRMTKAARERYVRAPRPRIVDFDEIEARNRAIGLAGELAVLEIEDRRLRKAGKRSLAERIEHVAKTRGDGLGYDLVSFELDGRERLIEVKTTPRALLTPFFVTRNEVEVSKRRAEVYHLYRLFRFNREPRERRFFVVQGSLDRVCRLEPTAFRAEVA